ncbi:hypothetical protein ACFQQB_29190 [Nonomuraea rubra]|uniref:hypothetical protein n=1 Tax=Nonomuraea rubra TaxID=46180 RepID=UPI003610A9E0
MGRAGGRATSEHDRRRAALRLTDSGHALPAGARAWQRRSFAELTASWDEPDRVRFAAYLERPADEVGAQLDLDATSTFLIAGEAADRKERYVAGRAADRGVRAQGPGRHRAVGPSPPQAGVPEGATVVTYAREQAFVLTLFAFAMAVETVVIDLLLVALGVPEWLRFGVLIADLYGLLFVAMMAAGCATRPHVVTSDEVWIRYGAYFEVRVPRDLIAAVRAGGRTTRTAWSRSRTAG